MRTTEGTLKYIYRVVMCEGLLFLHSHSCAPFCQLVVLHAQEGSHHITYTIHIVTFFSWYHSLPTICWIWVWAINVINVISDIIIINSIFELETQWMDLFFLLKFGTQFFFFFKQFIFWYNPTGQPQSTSIWTEKYIIVFSSKPAYFNPPCSPWLLPIAPPCSLPITFITFQLSELLPSEHVPFPLQIHLHYLFPLWTYMGSCLYKTDPRYVHPCEPFYTHTDVLQLINDDKKRKKKKTDLAESALSWLGVKPWLPKPWLNIVVTQHGLAWAETSSGSELTLSHHRSSHWSCDWSNTTISYCFHLPTKSSLCSAQHGISHAHSERVYKSKFTHWVCVCCWASRSCFYSPHLLNPHHPLLLHVLPIHGVRANR